MKELKGYQKKYLRGLAHSLKPVVLIGQGIKRVRMIWPRSLKKPANVNWLEILDIQRYFLGRTVILKNEK